MNSVICAIAKLENKYIYNWAKYHLSLGFKHIYIYDNNDIDGERIDDVFKNTDICNDITIINVRGQKVFQLKAYNSFYRHYDFDWCAYIDLDEFITINPASGFTRIDQLIMAYQAHDAIVLNWLCFGDCGRIHFDSVSVTERFTNPIKPLYFVASLTDGTPENYHVKSIIKKGLDIDWEEDHYPFKNPHLPSRLSDIVNAQGYTVNNTPWQKMDYSIAYIRHYTTMSIEEYIRKVNRGAADSDSPARYKVSRFFRYNRITTNKLSIIKKITGSLPLFQIIIERFKWLSITYNWPSKYFFSSFRKAFKTNPR